MKTSLIAVVLCSMLSVAHADQKKTVVTKAQAPVCDRCAVILGDIHQALLDRCETAPALEELRKQSIYLFLSIFDEVSQGGNKVMAEQVYAAAIEGMECANPDAGVQAAQKMANQLMSDNRT